MAKQLSHPREYCGVFGVYNVPNAASCIFNGLFALQHRGQEGAGIVVSDGERVRHVKGLGLLAQVINQRNLSELAGLIGIGHVRYSTTGSSRASNVQPLVVECADGLWAVAHNGNLTNAKELRHAYQEAGAIFQTSTDSEILVHLIADPKYRKKANGLALALSRLEGAFSYLIMTKDMVVAARDRFGFRPLVFGRLGEGYVFASETSALNQVGATYEGEVEPGEMFIVDARGPRRERFAKPERALGQCVFELIYFARPDSIVFGENVHQFRQNLGRRLAQESPVEADAVIPVPDSGVSAAIGYSQESGIPLDFGFIRNHYVGRTFIMPVNTDRADSVNIKLAVVSSVVKGKRLVVVDDSIVRGTTSRKRVAALRKAGAREVHLRISCPPTRHPCFFGIDFPSKKELLADDLPLEKIRESVGADSLAYLSLDSLKTAVKDPSKYCLGCFTGKYPTATDGDHTKQSLEI